MSKWPDRRRNAAEAIFADEIGIEYGIHGDFRLKTAYQPIFAPRGNWLTAVAVEALVEPPSCRQAGCAVGVLRWPCGDGSPVRRDDVPDAASQELSQHRRRWARPVLQLTPADQRSSSGGRWPRSG